MKKLLIIALLVVGCGRYENKVGKIKYCGNVEARFDNWFGKTTYNIGGKDLHTIEELSDTILNVTGADKSLVNYKESEETTHYSVVDRWGNAVSVTTTINGWYGSGIVVDGAGFLLNNEMDDFSAKPGVPNTYGLIGNTANAIEPGKRMLSSMSPTIVETPEGELFLVVGSPGGSTIITTTCQIIMNVIDFGMDLEDAVEIPRFHHQWLPDMIQFEEAGFSSETIEALEKRGHSIILRRSIGEANCILLEEGLIYGSADSRRNSSAVGY